MLGLKLLGPSVGFNDGYLGAADGLFERTFGTNEGSFVGFCEGDSVGIEVGPFVGKLVGFIDGETVGTSVGLLDGINVGY